MMELAIWIALALIVGYVVSGAMGSRHIAEGFTTPLRSDIGYARDGWEEESGYERDLRYSETFADVQGLGVASDFCRAVQQKGDPSSLRMACALGRRDGFDTMEYRSRSRGEGFRWSRDDYWRSSEAAAGRMDYCRIVKDEMTGEWYSSCAISGRNGFNVTEERDTQPPPRIRQLLEAYEGAVTWYRLFDDVEDYAQNTVLEFHGRPDIPTLLKADISRGIQFNRLLTAGEGATKKPPHDYVRWGEPGTLALDQTVQPRQIRAISFWVWMDTLEGKPRVLDCSNEGGKQDRVWIGIEGGAPDLPGAIKPRIAAPAEEVRPDVALALGVPVAPLRAEEAVPMTLPRNAKETEPRNTATWVFEIWDGEQRIMRLAGPQAARREQWQHVVVTTTDTTTWWPTWQMWVDGRVVANRVEGRTIPTLKLAENYLGRGLRGCLQDFRVYTEPMTAEKIAAARRFTQPRLHPSP
jgi:hypothetical protein